MSAQIELNEVDRHIKTMLLTYPTLYKFRRTPRNLLKLAVQAEKLVQAEQERIRESREKYAAMAPVSQIPGEGVEPV